MKKQNNTKKLGKSKDQREALIKSQVRDLLTNGHLRTTKIRAEVVGRRIDALLSFVEEKNEKMVSEYLANKEALKKAMSIPTNGRKSGFVSFRTIKNRPGDNAELVLIEIINK